MAWCYTPQSDCDLHMQGASFKVRAHVIVPQPGPEFEEHMRLLPQFYTWVPGAEENVPSPRGRADRPKTPKP